MEGQQKLSVAIERLEGEFAVLRNEAAGEFRWPLSGLPNNVRVGDVLTVAWDRNAPVDDLDEKRRMLEELIN